MMHMGLDPGKSGGIAVLDDAGTVVCAVEMPATDRDILDVMEAAVSAAQGVMIRALLERVSSSPQMGVVSAFTFGGNYRALKMALTASVIPFDEIQPAKWQQVMGCLTKGDKNISKRRAQQLFPTLKITHAIADALLLAECCRRMR